VHRVTIAKKKDSNTSIKIELGEIEFTTLMLLETFDKNDTNYTNDVSYGEAPNLATSNEQLCTILLNAPAVSLHHTS
jgi:hypothetical protein